MLDLHYMPTPNGYKVAIMLEEIGADYKVIPYDLFSGEHLTSEFRALNLNQRTPILVDRDDEDNPFVVFESGAILLYLAEKTGMLLPTEIHERSVANQWLIWQMSSLGPFLGQAHHFVRYAPAGQVYAIDRYVREAKRLISVLDSRLGESEYLAKELSIADVACWPWLQGLHLLGIDRTQWPSIERWSDSISKRKSIQTVAGSAVLRMPEHYAKPRMDLTKEQWDRLFSPHISSVS